MNRSISKSQAKAQQVQTQHAQTEAQQKSPLAQAREQVAQTNNINLWFSRFASKTARLVGHPMMFLAAIATLVVWGISGPIFHYSDTWQLVINTATSLLTFLIVFLIQNTQNRDAKAIHLKLDELIRSHSPAHNDMIDIENLSDEELDELEKRYAAICEENQSRREKANAGSKTKFRTESQTESQTESTTGSKSVAN